MEKPAAAQSGSPLKGLGQEIGNVHPRRIPVLRGEKPPAYAVKTRRKGADQCAFGPAQTAGKRTDDGPGAARKRRVGGLGGGGPVGVTAGPRVDRRNRPSHSATSTPRRR